MKESTMPQKTSFLRRLAIRLNGAPVQVTTSAPAPAAIQAPRTVCRPSSGGLDNPRFEYRGGADLRNLFASRQISGGSAE